MMQAEIGIIGGSGFYRFLEDAEEVAVETPYGPPSDALTVGTVGGRSVAFLPRHGRDHSLPPHSIDYRANLWALKEMGVTRVLAPCACGSLDRNIHPGEVVICDQVVDRTNGRKDTFYDGPRTVHVSFADPYCTELRPIAFEAASGAGMVAHPDGTMVVIQGPRFSTRAESEFHSRQGWSVVSMTHYPEVVLARELEMCFVGIALVTDYDAGLPGAEAVTVEAVLGVLRRNNEKLKDLLAAMIPKIPKERFCACATALGGAGL